MSAWAVKYRDLDWGAFVIEATADKAKNRFHEHFQTGNLADVSCIDVIRLSRLSLILFADARE